MELHSSRRTTTRPPMDWIRIDGLKLRCIVGLYSYERHREQPVQMDIALGLDLSTAGRSGRIEDTSDYSRVAEAITALLRFREYQLLEVAVEETAAFLFAAHPEIQRLQLRLDKPGALAGRARSAAVEIAREREAFGTHKEPTAWGERVELLRTREAVIEKICLHPGARASFTEELPRFEWPVGVKSADGRGPSEAITLTRGGASLYQAAPSSSAAFLVRCVLQAR